VLNVFLQLDNNSNVETSFRLLEYSRGKFGFTLIVLNYISVALLPLGHSFLQSNGVGLQSFGRQTSWATGIWATLGACLAVQPA